MSNKSFTLLELLLVLVLVGIVLGLSFPRISRNARNLKFKSAVNKTYLFLDYVKTKSILKGIVLEINFDVQNEKIFLSEAQRSGKAFRELTFPEGIKFQASSDKVLFYPDSTSQEFELTIFDQKQRQAKIYSEGVDGKIVVVMRGRLK